MSRIAFVGAGSWGTTMAATVAAKRRDEVILWSRRAELAETINLFHENPEYLPDVKLPESLLATHDLEEALNAAAVVVMGVPSHGFRAVLKDVAAIAGNSVVYVSLTKGIEVETRKRMSEVIAEEVEGIDARHICVLSGPNLANEVVRGYPAASTVASPDVTVAEDLRERFHTSFFRCYTNTDVAGCEIGGALKNVLAIACGVADGMGFGDNTKAAVMTRGLAEMARFAVKFGAKPLTLLGMAGVGDLIATCASGLSRNHTVGIELGRGRKINEILGSMRMVAEGVKSCKPLYELGKDAGVVMPITEAVYHLCHESYAVEAILDDLLTREFSSEFEGLPDFPLSSPN
jgi:glycerol-3-phosphate dehydrogenase (NAD(P)+)